MNQIKRDFIIIRIPAKDKNLYKARSAEILDIFSKSGIDLTNAIILPDDINISTISLPIVDN